MDYKIDVGQYSPRDLYLMWLIHDNPPEFMRQNGLRLVFANHQGLMVPEALYTNN
jgi:hypothetical protein